MPSSIYFLLQIDPTFFLKFTSAILVTNVECRGRLAQLTYSEGILLLDYINEQKLAQKIFRKCDNQFTIFLNKNIQRHA